MASRESLPLADGDERSRISRSGSPVPIPLKAMPMERLKISLHQAARDGREDIVRLHLSHLRHNKAKVLDKKDADGFTAMHYAAKFNRFKIMSRLITEGANCEIKTTDEQLTPLHLSTRYLPRLHEKESETTDGETEVSVYSTSRRAVELLVKFCRVNVNAQDFYGISPLHVACSRGNLDALNVLLDSPDIQIDITDNNKDTPLHEACLLGDPEIVKKLLEHMKAKDMGFLIKNDSEQTPLHLACRKGFPSIVKLILQYGFGRKEELVRCTDMNFSTPLHLACESGDDTIVQVLLLNGADMEALKEEDRTPLHTAARSGFVKIARILVDAKKEILKAMDAFQQTPLHRATQYNQCDMIDFLLDQGAVIDALDERSYTPLLTAAAYGHTEALKRLLYRGAPVDALDKDGKSAVFLAAQENHTSVLQELISNPIGLQLCQTVSSTHDTPLHIAAKAGNIEAVRMLLRASVKIDSRNEISKTPMHLAAENGHTAVVRELIRYQPDTVHDKDEDSSTPLHLACINGHLGVAKVLIAANCDVEARNDTLWTPMDCAANGGYDELVSLLIKAEADVDPTDKSKVTPLHLAAKEGHLTVVRILLQNKADVANTDTQGNNALDLAIENGHEAVAMEIVNSPKWEVALRNTTEAQWGGVTTPLRKLIRKMPQVAEEVFNKCTVTNASKDGRVRSDSRDYQVFFNYEFLDDFRDLDSRAVRLARQFTIKPRRQRLVLDSEDEVEETDSITSSSKPPLSSVEDGHMDMITKLKGRQRHNFTTTWGPERFQKSRHPLSIMVQSEQIDLLKHPLVTSLLKYKWQTYGRYAYFVNLLVYAIFLFYLTTFALLVPNPETMTCQAVFDGSFGNNNSNESAAATDDISDEMMDIIDGSCDSVLSPSRERFLILAGVIVIISCLTRLLLELFQVFQLRVWRYVLDWVNWLEVLLFVCSIIFVITYFEDCLCPRAWQWQLGAVAVFLGWVDLIIFLSKLPFIGIYVVMFIDIFYTFCRLFILSTLLVIAFGLAFFMAFNEPDRLRTPFSTPARALLKTITMTTGEFEFDGIFRQATGGIDEAEVLELGEIPFPPLSYILWIVFIILMPILLTNLLVGLAVDDIKGILEAAVLKRLALQVELVLNVEELFPQQIRRWFIIGSRHVFPNRDLSVWEKFRYSAWGGERFDSSEKIDDALHPPRSPIVQVQSQTQTLTREMDGLRRSVMQLSERNQRLEEMLSAVVKHHGIKLEDETTPTAPPTSALRERKLPSVGSVAKDDVTATEI